MLKSTRKKLFQSMAVLLLFYFIHKTLINWWFSRQQLTTQFCHEGSRQPSAGASKGRSPDDGQWFVQTEPFHLYVYSAFYDNRTTLHITESLISLIVVSDKQALQKRLWCRLFYDQQQSQEQVLVVVEANACGAGMGIGENVHLIEYVFVCHIRRDACVPTSVSLSWGYQPQEQTSFRVPVERTRQLNRRLNMAVCVSASYDGVDRLQLVEWLEMQRILGVQLVVIYNHSLTGQAVDVLHRYSSSNRSMPFSGLLDEHDDLHVELRQSHDFLPSGKLTQSHYIHMSPVINDCMYRFSGSFKHFAIIDLDEVIVPRTDHRSLPGLIAGLTKSAGNRIGTFVFRNAYFFLEFQSDGRSVENGHHSEATFSTYINSRRRLRPSPPRYSVKSIVDSDACIAMHNHFCWNFTPSFLSRYHSELEVLTDIALLHHYKRCHFDSYLSNPGVCKLMMTKTVFDDVVRKYELQLSDRLATQYSKLFNSTVAN